MPKYLLIILIICLFSSCNKHVLKEKDLLSHSTLENLDKFGTFLWSKNENDSIIFNQKNLNRIKVKKGKYFKSFVFYTSFLLSPRYDAPNLDFTENCKVLAYLSYFGENIQLQDKYSFLRTIIGRDQDLEYYNEFEKKNYYNLPELKKQYRVAFEKFGPPPKTEDLPAIIIIKKPH